jgi:membrane protein
MKSKAFAPILTPAVPPATVEGKDDMPAAAEPGTREGTRMQMPPSNKPSSGMQTIREKATLACRNWWGDNPFRLASSLAFYTVFSLAPILLITVGLASVIFSEEEAKRQVVRQVAMMTGSAGASVARQVLNNIGEIGKNPKAIFVGISALLVGSTAVFINLQAALNDIWKVKPSPERNRWKGLILDRIRSFGIVLAVGFLLLVSMVFSALITGMEEYLMTRAQGLSWVWKLSNTSISYIVTTLLFAMIYKYLPDVRIGWGAVMAGAAITAALFSVGKLVIGLYIGRTAIGSAYGAAGSFVVLLVWIYYSALICFLGAEITRVYVLASGTRIRPEPHAVRSGPDSV